jgi:3-hydroxyacyl-CoA dehydrogenase
MYERIAILGSGVIGAGWAVFFASKGKSVQVYDNNPEALAKGMTTVRRQLEHLRDLGVLSEPELEKAQNTVAPAESLEDLLSNADYIQESVIEDYDIKAQVYRELEEYCRRDTVIASSSSGLLITRMQQALQNPERALIAHPFNPPHLIPLVELVQEIPCQSTRGRNDNGALLQFPKDVVQVRWH